MLTYSHTTTVMFLPMTCAGILLKQWLTMSTSKHTSLLLVDERPITSQSSCSTQKNRSHFIHKNGRQHYRQASRQKKALLASAKSSFQSYHPAVTTTKSAKKKHCIYVYIYKQYYALMLTFLFFCTILIHYFILCFRCICHQFNK